MATILQDDRLLFFCIPMIYYTIREIDVSVLHCSCILTVIFEHICQQFVVGLVDDVAF
jgi:hypothetical protein